MKRKTISFLFMLGVLFHFSACQLPEVQMEESTSESGTSSQWLGYLETQCSDPWGACSKDASKTTCVKEHLEGLGVTVLEINVTGSTNGPVCMACQCASGRTFRVRVNSGDVSKVEAVGFKKI